MIKTVHQFTPIVDLPRVTLTKGVDSTCIIHETLMSWRCAAIVQHVHFTTIWKPSLSTFLCRARLPLFIMDVLYLY